MSDHRPRIGFAGTPAFAASHLQALLDAGYLPALVYTQPDRPSGRGKKLLPGPVKQLALAHQLPLRQPLSLKGPAAAEELQQFGLDVLIVVAYGLLLPPSILETPRYGCMNVHASLLPRWRGAAPIERAILAGDAESGVTLMQMNAGLDTGDILLQLRTPISSEDNAATLGERLTRLGQQVLLQGLEALGRGELHGSPQDDAASSYAQKLEKSEALIDWNRPACEIQRQVNAFYPRSPAWCFSDRERIRILRASALPESSGQQAGTILRVDSTGLLVACQDSSLLISEVQLPGKKPAAVSTILNGQAQRFRTGAALLSQEQSS